MTKDLYFDDFFRTSAHISHATTVKFWREGWALDSPRLILQKSLKRFAP